VEPRLRSREGQKMRSSTLGLREGLCRNSEVGTWNSKYHSTS
jgi:hypothetical protein